MAKPETIENLKVRVWRWFSRYIRLRDAKNGYCNCISCGRTHHWKEMQAGHFVPKARGNAIYFNETNSNAQCAYCNKWKSGNLSEYRVAIDKKYGKGTADEMERLAAPGKTFTVDELKKMLKYYIKKTHELEKTNQ